MQRKRTENEKKGSRLSVKKRRKACSIIAKVIFRDLGCSQPAAQKYPKGYSCASLADDELYFKEAIIYMGLLQVKEGNLSFYIECTDLDMEQTAGTRNTIPSGIGSNILQDASKKIFEQAGEIAVMLLENIKKGFGTPECCPKELEMEMNFQIAASGKIIVLSGETECGIKMKMKWIN